MLKYFYFSQILKDNASLLETLEEMHTLSLKMFFNSLNCNANKLLEKVKVFSSSTVFETWYFLQIPLVNNLVSFWIIWFCYENAYVRSK